MKKVLFVCTANIHRSRFAEEVFNYLCAKHNKDYHAFSAGLRVGDYSYRKIYFPALENLKDFNIIPKRPNDLSKHIKDVNLEKMSAKLLSNTVPMGFHSALGALRSIVKQRPDAILVNEGANTLDFARSIIDIYKPRKRLDVGTWGIMGIGMGAAIAAAVETGHPVLAVEGDSAFGFSGMEIETICRYNLPVCVVVFNNNGIYRGTDTNPTGGPDAAPTVFVKDARYDQMMAAFGGVGLYATTPDELTRAVNEAMDKGKPTLVNAVIDENSGTESGRIGNLNPQSVVSKK